MNRNVLGSRSSSSSSSSRALRCSKVVALLAALFFCKPGRTTACVDDDLRLATIAAMATTAMPSGTATCSDAIEFCADDRSSTLEGALVRTVCCSTCRAQTGFRETCADVPDPEFRRASIAFGGGRPREATGCSDATAIELCARDGTEGQLARALCCATCGNNNNSSSSTPVSAVDPATLPPDDKPLKVFLLGGQSECVGAARAEELYRDSETYPELQGTVEGVWFAGYKGKDATDAAPDNFFIAPMSADVDRPAFGPEVSFGERIYAATGATSNILVVKYCIGGTNVRSHWNPGAPDNAWDKTRDDGSAGWIEPQITLSTSHGASVGSKADSKNHQFINAIYTIRRTKETLDAAGIPHTWSGIVWVQGAADDNSDDPELWKTFGENTARVWEGFREELGRDVPVVDTGGSTRNQMKSGKEYATQIVDGCAATTVEYAVSASDDTGTCVVGASNACLGDPSRFVNYELFEEYGWDPNFTDDLIPPSAATQTTFRWFAGFPDDMHSAYEGQILKGRMLAHAHLRRFAGFSDSDLSPYRDDDVAFLFPFDPCPDGVLPSESDLCWIDYREEPPSPPNRVCATSSSSSSSAAAASRGRWVATMISTAAAVAAILVSA